MADQLALDLVEKGLVTDQIVLTVGYDRENLTDPLRRGAYGGEITSDRYGRPVPKHAHGTRNLDQPPPQPESSGKRRQLFLTGSRIRGFWFAGFM